MITLFNVVVEWNALWASGLLNRPSFCCWTMATWCYLKKNQAPLFVDLAPLECGNLKSNGVYRHTGRTTRTELVRAEASKA